MRAICAGRRSGREELPIRTLSSQRRVRFTHVYTCVCVCVFKGRARDCRKLSRCHLRRETHLPRRDRCVCSFRKCVVVNPLFASQRSEGRGDRERHTTDSGINRARRRLVELPIITPEFSLQARYIFLAPSAAPSCSPENYVESIRFCAISGRISDASTGRVFNKASHGNSQGPAARQKGGREQLVTRCPTRHLVSPTRSRCGN